VPAGAVGPPVMERQEPEYPGNIGKLTRKYSIKPENMH
jgi:hypothetical protein